MAIRRRALLGVGMLLLAASCGGSGKPKGDGGNDAPYDTPLGDTVSDRPYDGGGGDADPGGDATGTPKQPLGTPCALGSDCQSGFCADGVCCSTACTEVCRSCAAQGSVGTCLPVDVGTDPRNECDDLGVASCSSKADSKAAW